MRTIMELIPRTATARVCTAVPRVAQTEAYSGSIHKPEYLYRGKRFLEPKKASLDFCPYFYSKHCLDNCLFWNASHVIKQW